MRPRSDDFISPLKPAEPIGAGEKQPTPAPAWLALFAAWGGLAMMIAAVVFVFLPGTHHARAELEHAAPYSPADRFLPVPIYGITIAMFLGIIVIWQMRRMPRPLPPPMLMQRVQAWTGIALAFLGAVIIYTNVALRGPK